mmetsp:Transcript_1771/g.5144  ORF Transcript_1771/g.5144 Transcript_1771/m.5144 type:complete len:241 (-) Transcript_1771:406-1128(-)
MRQESSSSPRSIALALPAPGRGSGASRHACCRRDTASCTTAKRRCLSTRSISAAGGCCLSAAEARAGRRSSNIGPTAVSIEPPPPSRVGAAAGAAATKAVRVRHTSRKYTTPSVRPSTTGCGSWPGVWARARHVCTTSSTLRAAAAATSPNSATSDGCSAKAFEISCPVSVGLSPPYKMAMSSSLGTDSSDARPPMPAPTPDPNTLPMRSNTMNTLRCSAARAAEKGAVPSSCGRLLCWR